MSEKQEHEQTRNIKLSAELKAFEAELAALVPEDKSLDRARLLYAAGRTSARRQARVAACGWAAAFGAMSLVSAALLVALLVRAEPPVKIVERIIHIPAKATPRVPGAETRMAGAKQSDAPEDMFRYPMPKKTNVLAAVFFGATDDLTNPIRRRPRWSVLRGGDLFEDFNVDSDFEDEPATTVDRQSTTPKPPKPKSYRELFNELIETHG